MGNITEYQYPYPSNSHTNYKAMGLEFRDTPQDSSKYGVKVKKKANLAEKYFWHKH
jgi:hypothetical protein